MYIVLFYMMKTTISSLLACFVKNESNEFRRQLLCSYDTILYGGRGTKYILYLYCMITENSICVRH